MANNFKIIAFGSSAGGLKPLMHILQQLPADLNAAILVIPHLSRDHHSNLDQILTRIHSQPVTRILSGEHIKKGKTYVMPEGQILSIKAGKLLLRKRQDHEVINRAIDYLFTSLSAYARERAIGVILSGAGYDGIEGAKAIEDNKGIIIVQEPYTAEFPLMPQSLIAFDHPDYILTPDDIVQKLIDACS